MIELEAHTLNNKKTSECAIFAREEKDFALHPEEKKGSVYLHYRQFDI